MKKFYSICLFLFLSYYSQINAEQSIVLKYKINNDLITNYDISKITPLTLIVPIFAIINSLIVTHFNLFDGFNESISIKIIIGAAMTLIGVGIVMVREKNIDVSSRL